MSPGPTSAPSCEPRWEVKRVSSPAQYFPDPVLLSLQNPTSLIPNCPESHAGGSAGSRRRVVILIVSKKSKRPGNPLSKR